jgi:hypothetical protein
MKKVKKEKKFIKVEKVDVGDVRLMTRMRHDATLYRVITNMTEHLRSKNVSDKIITTFLVDFVLSTIKEV